jgi:signal transduction histidine kinase
MTAGGGNAWHKPDRVLRSGAVPPALGTAALGLTVVGLAPSEHGLDLAPGLPAWLALSGIAVLVALASASWVVMSERPHVATGLSVTVVGLALPSWAAWDWLPVAMLPILHAAAPMVVAGAAHVGLGWSLPGGHVRTLALIYVLATLGSVLISVGYDPLADPGCAFTCADADPVAGSLITTRVTVVVTAVLMSAGALLSGWSIAGRRRDPFALRLGVLAAIGVLAASWVAHALWWADGVPGVALVASAAAAGALLAVGVLVSAWVVRRNRIVAEQLIAELNDAHAPGGPMHGGRAVEFAMPDEDRWVDSDGRTVPADVTRRGTVAHHMVGDSAVRVWLAREPSAPTFDAISQGARVALANARLSAVIKARVAEVQGSRRRIARASHAERQRIARDLHDGAQQRLITASLHLSVAQDIVPAPVLEQAHTAIGEALERLRRLAHDLVPEAPATEGLRTVLHALVRESPVPAEFEMPDVAVDDDVVVAVHAAVASVLAHAGIVRADKVRVEVDRLSPDRIGLRIEAVGSSKLDEWDGSAVADRIGAVGGTTTVRTGPTRLFVSAELPCVS